MPGIRPLWRSTPSCSTVRPCCWPTCRWRIRQSTPSWCAPELNADSAPYAALKKAVDAGDQATVEKYAKLLYGQALLLADLPLEDPAEYAQLVCSLMA